MSSHTEGEQLYSCTPYMSSDIASKAGYSVVRLGPTCRCQPYVQRGVPYAYTTRLREFIEAIYKITAQRVG